MKNIPVTKAQIRAFMQDEKHTFLITGKYPNRRARRLINKL